YNFYIIIVERYIVMTMQKLESDRMGVVVRQRSGYSAFIPHKLNDIISTIEFDAEMIKLLSEADRALGELKGLSKVLQEPDLFIACYVQKEALLSSQIEGTECSLDDVIQVEGNTLELKPVHEVVNYINAMNEGLLNLKKLPMSSRLLHIIHNILLQDVRGKEKEPGSFKRYQNWIGPPGCNLSEATYVPPPPYIVNDLMGDWELYYNDHKELPPLIEAALLHYYFETIHPYIDGNRRLGRLLITFMLCERKVLTKPLLYLSLFFKENRKDYYQLLMNARFKGELEEWIKFFLRGVRNTSKEATKTALEIKKLHTKDFDMIKVGLAGNRIAVPFFELVCSKPIVSISGAAKILNSTYPTTKNIIKKFVERNILKAYKGVSKKSTFVYAEYLEILKRGT
ncbi:MAG: Fic family protein, partial [Candidatus Omnitrophota bacterium]